MACADGDPRSRATGPADRLPADARIPTIAIFEPILVDYFYGIVASKHVRAAIVDFV